MSGVDDPQRHERAHREQEVHGGAGEGDDERVVARTAHPPGRDWYRLRVAEHTQRRRGQDERQYDRAEGIEVPGRVERDPAGPLRGVVTAPQRDGCVGHLMQHQ